MLQDFLQQRRIQQDDQGGVWSSENVNRITEDSNDTDEVFFKRPNGAFMTAAPRDEPNEKGAWTQGGPTRAALQSTDSQPSVAPSAWGSRPPHIHDMSAGEPVAGAKHQISMMAGFGQVDCPEGLMAFELPCEDPCTNAFGVSSSQDSNRTNSKLEVDTKESTQDESSVSEEGQNKSPSVALKMMLGIGQGGAAPSNEPAYAPPAARKLPVWGKPDGRIDISMDPAIAQIAKDMPPPAAIPNPDRCYVNRHMQDSNANANKAGSGIPWDREGMLQGVPPPDPLVRPEQGEVALNQRFAQQPTGRDMMPSGVLANPTQPMPHLQGPAAFLQSMPHEQRVDTGGMGQTRAAMSDTAPSQQNQSMQPEDVLRHLQKMSMPSERPPDPIFPFGMGAPGGVSNSDMPNMQPQGMHNMFAMGMGGMGMMPSRSGDNSSMPPWMQPQQMQGQPMGMRSMGMMHMAGSHPGDNPNLPPWMQQHQQEDMRSQGGLSNLPPPGIGMGMTSGPNGPMAGMGLGGGMDLHKMLVNGAGSMPDHSSGVSFQQGQSDSNGPSQMGGTGACRPPGQPSGDGFGFGSGSGGRSIAPHGVASDAGGGNFDFDKFFGGVKMSGPSGNSQMSDNGVPRGMRSLAGDVCSPLARLQHATQCWAFT